MRIFFQPPPPLPRARANMKVVGINGDKWGCHGEHLWVSGCLSLHAEDVGLVNSWPVCTQAPLLPGTSPFHCRYRGRERAMTNTSPPCWSRFGHQHSSASTRVQAHKHHPSQSTMTTPMNRNESFDSGGGKIFTASRAPCQTPRRGGATAMRHRAMCIGVCARSQVPAAKCSVQVPFMLCPRCRLHQALQPPRPP